MRVIFILGVITTITYSIQHISCQNVNVLIIKDVWNIRDEEISPFFVFLEL